MLTNEQTQKGMLWFLNHTDYVIKLITGIKKSYPPTNIEDQNNPNLWKPEHWKWFVQTNCYGTSTPYKSL